MIVHVIDAQGGGLGKKIVQNLLEYNKNLEIVALGTNVIATSAMLKAGATRGATGENAIIFNSNHAKIIIGALGIIAPNSMLGEISPKIANAISSSGAEKILIPVSKCGTHIAGLKKLNLNLMIKDAIEILDKI